MDRERAAKNLRINGCPLCRTRIKSGGWKPGLFLSTFRARALSPPAVASSTSQGRSGAAALLSIPPVSLRVSSSAAAAAPASSSSSRVAGPRPASPRALRLPALPSSGAPTASASFLASPGDDLPQIICQLPPGSRLVLAPGDYVLDRSIALDHELHIVGSLAPHPRSIIRSAGFDAIVCSAPGTMRGLVIHTSSAQAPSSFVASASSSSISDVVDLSATGACRGRFSHAAIESWRSRNAFACIRFVGSAATGTMKECQISSEGRAGVEIMSAADPTLLEVSIDDCAWAGVLVSCSCS